MINYINSRSNQKVVHVSRLKDKKYIKEYQEFLIEGVKSLELAVKSGLVEEVYTLKELKLPYNIPQFLVTPEIIDKISSNQNPEGVVAVCSLLKEVKPEKFNKVVYLDDISDPGNMGTLIRTALAFNYDAIILSEKCVSIYNPKVVAASKGAMFSIPILTGKLKDFKNGQKVIASTLSDKTIPLEKCEKLDSFILVLGNEAHGISQEVEKLSDIFVKIPIENIDSLNVAIAGGVLMYHFK